MKNFIRQWLGINDICQWGDSLNKQIPKIHERATDIDTRLGHLAKRVDDNEALLKRIYDHLRAIWKI